MTGFFASLAGKVLSVVIGALVCALALAYVSNLRKENVRLVSENTRLISEREAIEANARLTMRLLDKRRTQQEAAESRLDKVIHELRTKPVPKLPPVCDRSLDLVRDAVDWLQRQGGKRDLPPDSGR